MIESTKKVRLSGEESKAHRREYQRQFAANYRATHPKPDRREYLKAWGKRRDPAYKKTRKKLDAARYATKKTKSAARSAAYHKAKKEEIAARKAAWRAANIKARRAKEKAYRQSPRGKIAMHNAKARRKALKLACENPATVSQILALKERQTNCHYCGVASVATKEGALTIDHFYPLKMTGPHMILNLVMACKSCNSRKSYSLPAAWAKRSGFTFIWPLMRQPDGTFLESGICPAGPK